MSVELAGAIQNTTINVGTSGSLTLRAWVAKADSPACYALMAKSLETFVYRPRGDQILGFD